MAAQVRYRNMGTSRRRAAHACVECVECAMQDAWLHAIQHVLYGTAQIQRCVLSVSTPPFSRRWEHFSKIGLHGSMGNAIPHGTMETDFLKNVLIFEKKGGCWFFFPCLYGGLYGQNLPYKFKNSYGDFRNCNFENHILVELLVPGQIWDRIRDPEQILV